MAQSSHAPALHEFLRWESQAWVEVVADMTTDEKAYIMPLEDLETYFMANNSKALSRILSEVFKSQYPPIDPELVLRDHTAVFCILLRIGQGRQIEHFVRYEELCDRRLPFDPNHPPRGFPLANDDPAFLLRFCEKQWMYCAPVFDTHMLHKHFGPQRLLPITEREQQGTDGIADKYVIKLHGPHNKLISGGQERIENPNANTFVLKRYKIKDSEDYYKQEVNGFRSVRQADSIIRFYGSYLHGEDSNIVLEYADRGSLEDYFQTETPPSRGVDIIRFWEALFQLINGVKAIHSVREGHHNIKPESVLVLSNGAKSSTDWQFKFADFGLKTPRGRLSQDRETMDGELQDIPTYGAPECYLPYNLDNQSSRSSPKVTWAADIWSLGCIYSEAAMWIADGYKGLVDFRRQRKAETDRILFKGGDCFHDGQQVLQSVLDAHSEIEDRLRRSDNITKDVLDSMVDEMLWEEDRPNAKALSRKAEVILTRARQKSSGNSAGDEFSRPGSSQGRSLVHELSRPSSVQSRPLPPRLQPPTQPLPPIPRGPPRSLTSIAERQYPPSVENWRSQVTVSRNSGSQFSGPASELTSPTASTMTSQNRHLSSSESASDLDRELTGSIASWQMGDDNTLNSPITPFTSPPGSIRFDYNRHNPNEGRVRDLQSRSPQDYKRQPKALLNGQSYLHTESSQHMVPPMPELHGAYTQAAMAISSDEVQWNSGSKIVDPKASDETRTIGRSASLASSRHSSIPYSTPRLQSAQSTATLHEIIPIPSKSQKRNAGFSLFPRKNSNSANEQTARNVESAPSSPRYDDTPRSIPSISERSGITPAPSQSSQSMEYLSLEACLEWKRAQKAAKKNTKIPQFPGANRLERLNYRDHVFIIDDSKTMSSVWPDVKRVFEALSYVVKGMSADGTELFFTVSYDTYLRKNTADLCKYLDAKTTAGETNISYRLNLQLQSYRAKIINAKGLKGKKGMVRPLSFYVLTNGEWGKGLDPKAMIKENADFLIEEKFTNGQVTIEFINFAQSEGGAEKVNDLAATDFGLSIVDSTPWTGNVLKMLRGALDHPT